MILGGLMFVGVPTILEVKGQALISVAQPEARGAPLGLHAAFFDERSHLVAEIVANEWRPRASNWDVETVGCTTTIWSASREVALAVRTAPPLTIHVERINMHYGGLHLVGQTCMTLDAYLSDGTRWFRAEGSPTGGYPMIAGCTKGIVVD